MVCHLSSGKLKAGVQEITGPVNPSDDSGSEVKPARRRNRGRKPSSKLGSPKKVSKTVQTHGEYYTKYFEEMKIRESATGSSNQPDQDVQKTVPEELETGKGPATSSALEGRETSTVFGVTTRSSSDVPSGPARGSVSEHPCTRDSTMPGQLHDPVPHEQSLQDTELPPKIPSGLPLADSENCLPQKQLPRKQATSSKKKEPGASQPLKFTSRRPVRKGPSTLVSFMDTVQDFSLQEGDDDEEDALLAPVLQSPVCRLTVKCGATKLNVCIDSGATLSLMSKKAYDIVRALGEDYTTELRPVKQTIRGASGAPVRVDGWTCLRFKIDEYFYEYALLVGGLSGVDILFGMDWLTNHKVKINFDTMIAEFSQSHTKTLRTTDEYHLQTRGVELSGAIKKEAIKEPGVMDGLVTTKKRVVIAANFATMIECKISGEWKKTSSIFFSPASPLCEGVQTSDALCLVDKRTVWIPVANRTTSEVCLEQFTALGTVAYAEEVLEPVGRMYSKGSGIEEQWEMNPTTLFESSLEESRDLGWVNGVTQDDIGDCFDGPPVPEPVPEATMTTSLSPDELRNKGCTTSGVTSTNGEAPRAEHDDATGALAEAGASKSPGFAGEPAKTMPQEGLVFDDMNSDRASSKSASTTERSYMIDEPPRVYGKRKYRRQYRRGHFLRRELPGETRSTTPDGATFYVEKNSRGRLRVLPPTEEILQRYIIYLPELPVVVYRST